MGAEFMRGVSCAHALWSALTKGGNQPQAPTRPVKLRSGRGNVAQIAHVPCTVRGRGAIDQAETLQPAGAIIRIEVVPADGRDGAAAIHLPACHRASLVVIGVFVHRQLQAGLVAASGVVAVRALHDPPTVIDAALRHRHGIDLLPTPLPYVRYIQHVVGKIEGEPPGITQPGCPDLGA